MFRGFLFFVKNGWKYDKRYILWNIFNQLLTVPIPLIAAFLPKLILDELHTSGGTLKLYSHVLLLSGFLLIIQIFREFFQKDGFTRRCRVAAEFDNDLHQRLYLCDYENLESPSFLELQEKSKKFLYCNWHGFGYLLDCALSILGQALSLLGITTLLATLNIGMIVFFVLLAVIGAYFDSVILKRVKRLEDAVIDDQRRWTYFASMFEKADFGREFRLYQVGEWLLGKERAFFTRSNDNLQKQNREFMKSGILSAVITFLEQFTAYAYLIYCVADGQISMGSFMMYISAVTSFASATRQIIHSLVEIQTYDLYYSNLDTYLSVPANLRSGTLKITSHKKPIVEFRNVSFKYPGNEYFTIKNVSISLQPGEKLLIVGENGAGKSTFVKLLLRLYDPTEGSILLNGHDIKEFDYDSYQSLFASVFQDYHLFAFSLRENIAMSAAADDKRILDILKQAGFSHKMEESNITLDTEIHKIFSSDGYEPSGGESQKIAVVRALYKNAPILVLDEPTAALDPRAEFDIYERFRHMVTDKTAVFISHRLSSAKFCDHIAVFDKGTICEYGTHDSLLQRNGKYAELFRMQADYYTL